MSNVVAQIYKSAKQTYNKQRILQIWNMKIRIPKRIDINTHWLRKKIQKHREFLVKCVVSNNIILQIVLCASFVICTMPHLFLMGKITELKLIEGFGWIWKCTKNYTPVLYPENVICLAWKTEICFINILKIYI